VESPGKTPSPPRPVHLKLAYKLPIQPVDYSDIKMGNKKETLARQILSYLEKHPQAGDTLEGIAAWWLEHECIEKAVEDVGEALRYLAGKGALQAHKIKNSPTIYKIKS
jgi:hypothetical protein